VNPTCPVTGLPIVRRPEWTNVELANNYTTSVEVVGGHIVHSMPRGYATRAGVIKVVDLHHRVIEQEIDPDTPHVHLADYSNIKGATSNARRYFAEDLSNRPGIAAVVFYRVSPLFRLSIKLARRFSQLKIPLQILPDYASAIRWSVDFLNETGVEGLGSGGAITGAAMSPQPESGTFELDGYQLQYETIDGHIIHGDAIGYLGLREMARHVEFENTIISSVDRSRGEPVLVANLNELEGVSSAARRLYVTTLRARQPSNPVALYVCYGVNTALRNAVNISRPFLPFRIRIARDRSTALEMARRESETGVLTGGPISRLRSKFFPSAIPAVQTRPTEIDDLLRLIANIDWENDGPVQSDVTLAPDHPVAPVVDALELIKAEVDELFRARRRSESALRESEERYRRILATIVDGYYEIDLDGRLQFFNDSLLRIFGHSRSEVEDIDTLSLMQDDSREIARDTFRGVYETGEPVKALVWDMRRKDGTLIFVETSASLITDLEGKPIGFRGILRDVTERVRTEQEKANLEAQLQRSQRMEAIGTLAGGIAHNFNNLLMGIQGNISLLAESLNPDDPHRKRLATIEALVDGGSKLTSQLLGYARSGRVDVRVIDLNELVLETAETFGLTRKEFRIHTDLAQQRLPVEVDPAQIEQALLNLFINAADAMPGGGDLYLSSRLVASTDMESSPTEIFDGDYASLSIRDTGCGMDEATVDRIFEPFFTTKGMTGGTGLGLASAYGIVKAHGGRIEVRSEVGEGTIFDLILPAAAGGALSADHLRDQMLPGEGTVLVVDDDQAVLEACAAMISHLQYTPICAGSGESAVDIFSRRKDEIDLIVLDLILTDLSGGEVFDRIKELDPSARVLLSSGYSLDGEAASILDRGCDDFIQKPFTIEQLSVKLGNILSRRDN
jgi:PAS domain S-box-containing protein